MVVLLISIYTLYVNTMYNNVYKNIYNINKCVKKNIKKCVKCKIYTIKL